MVGMPGAGAGAGAGAAAASSPPPPPQPVAANKNSADNHGSAAARDGAGAKVFIMKVSSGRYWTRPRSATTPRWIDGVTRRDRRAMGQLAFLKRGAATMAAFG
jgi:hypothetical protein